jgi:hypothetical protein
MLFRKFWIFKRKNSLRVIKTIRGKKKIEAAIKKGLRLVERPVEPYIENRGKYCVVKNKKTGEKHILGDYRDERAWDDDYEIIKGWTHETYEYKFPLEAAYVIPSDLKEGETVFILDLIENLDEFRHNQGKKLRLKSGIAVWENNDLQIRSIGCIERVG